MYNTKKICTYDTDEVFLETDLISEKDKEFVRNAIYRQEVLDILGINDSADAEMNKAFLQLYEIIKHNKELEECMTTLSNRYSEYCVNDALQNKCKFHIGLILLFAYEFMHSTHICISEFIETGKISQLNIDRLREKIISN